MKPSLGDASSVAGHMPQVLLLEAVVANVSKEASNILPVMVLSVWASPAPRAAIAGGEKMARRGCKLTAASKFLEAAAAHRLRVQALAPSLAGDGCLELSPAEDPSAVTVVPSTCVVGELRVESCEHTFGTCTFRLGSRASEALRACLRSGSVQDEARALQSLHSSSSGKESTPLVQKQRGIDDTLLRKTGPGRKAIAEALVRMGNRHELDGKQINDDKGCVCLSGVQKNLETRGIKPKTLQELSAQAWKIFEAKHHDLSGEKYGLQVFADLLEACEHVGVFSKLMREVAECHDDHEKPCRKTLPI